MTDRVVTCVYCGHAYESGSPTWGATQLTEHIRVCDKHPMRKLEADNRRLRTALEALCGVSTREEIEATLEGMRQLAVPEVELVGPRNALQALLDTIPTDNR